MTTLYEQDPYAWFAVQAALLGEKEFEKLDLKHLQQELLEMGESYARELESCLEILFAHLLKWQFQPEKRKGGWEASIKEHRKRCLKRLKKTPSLKYGLFEMVESAYEKAKILASEKTGLEYEVFPEYIPWIWDDISEEGWLPKEEEGK